MKIFSKFRVEDFKHVRFFRFVNLVAQVILALFLMGGLNYLASLPSFCARWDIDAQKRHSVSVETQVYLESLSRQLSRSTNSGEAAIRVIVTYRKPGAEDSKEDSFKQEKMFRQIKDLTEAFKYAVKSLRTRDFISFENANLLKDTRLVSEIRQKGGEVSAQTAIVVISSTRCRTIDSGELIKISRDATNGVVDYFRGEDVLMTRLLEVTDTNVPVVYALTGDGEYRIDDTNRRTGLSEFARELRSRNIRVSKLDLAYFEDVPEDASMVLIANPTVPVRPLTQEKLLRYLRDRNGRVLLLTGPGRREIGLEDLLFEWGVLLKDVFVVERRPASVLADNNVAMNASRTVPHKVSEILHTLELPIVASQFREVCRDIGSKEDSTRKVFEIATSSQGESILTSWSEQDYRKPPYRFDADRDTAGPVPVAVVSERVAGTRLGVNIPGGRIIVVGASDIASNSQLENGGNKPFLLNAINWLVERDVYLNIPPRPVSDFKLKATMPDLIRVAWWFAPLPIAVALLGLIVAAWRRRE